MSSIRDLVRLCKLGLVVTGCIGSTPLRFLFVVFKEFLERQLRNDHCRVGACQLVTPTR